MPKAAKVGPQEKEEIMKIAATMQANNPKTTLREIGEIVQRSKDTVLKVTEDEKFNMYKDKMRKKIEKTRLEAIGMGDKQIVEAVRKGKMKPYQIIGMSKTYWEQIFPQQNGTSVNVGGQNVAVQILRESTHSNTEAQSEPE